MRAQFDIVLVDEDRVFLVDLDLQGCMSVTNDAELVYKKVQQQHPGKRVIYRDSMGQWDEIVLQSNGRASYYEYHSYIPKV